MLNEANGQFQPDVIIAVGILIAKVFAETINQHVNHTDNPDVPELKVKDIGYNGYNN